MIYLLVYLVVPRPRKKQISDKAMKISITEFLQDKIKCPYLTKTERPDYNGANKTYNLYDPAERGQYLHAYIANKLDGIPFKYQDTVHNEEAEDILKWIDSNFKNIKFTAEQQLTKKYKDLIIVGKPDAYAIHNNELILIDFKFTESFVYSFIDQIIFYAGLITEQNSNIQKIRAYIKSPGREPTYNCFDRETVLQLYESVLSRVISFAEKAERNPGHVCEKCTKLGCRAKAEWASSVILTNALETYEGEDFSDKDARDMLMAVLYITQMGKIVVDGYTGKKSKSFQTCPEAVEEVLKASNGQADIKVTRTVSAAEAEKWLGKEGIEKYKTKESRPKIDALARMYAKTE